MRKALTTAAAAFMLIVPTAAAQQQQDGLVNVAIGDITVEDVNVAVAAQIVAAVCANVDLDLAVAIVGAIDAAPAGTTDQVCRIGRGQGGQTLTVTQN
jgi:hypothetical protein